MIHDSLSATVREWLLQPLSYEIGALVANAQQVLEDVRGLKSDLSSRFDAIDNVIDGLRAQVQSGQVDAAALDQIANEVSSARSQLDSVNPEDPSGDDSAPADQPADPASPTT
jgi:hypothetical protein